MTNFSELNANEIEKIFERKAENPEMIAALKAEAEGIIEKMTYFDMLRMMGFEIDTNHDEEICPICTGDRKNPIDEKDKLLSYIDSIDSSDKEKLFEFLNIKAAEARDEARDQARNEPSP